MKHERCISISSTSTEASTVEDQNGYKSLHRKDRQQCEFCDKLFKNRYRLLKHNVSHIIIPLIKQTTHECEQCLFHFTSIEDLANHIAKKHDLEPNYRPMKLKYEDNFKRKIPEILKSIVEKQVYVKCEDELKEVFVKGSEFMRNGFKKNQKLLENTILTSPKRPLASLKQESKSLNQEPISLKVEPISLNQEPVTLKQEPISLKQEPMSPDFKSPVREASPSNGENESIRHRLLFEEDLDDIEDNLFKDLTTDCQVNLESLCPDINNLPLDIPSDEIILGMPAIDFDRSSSSLEIVSNTGYRSNSLLEERVFITQEDTTDMLRYGKAIHFGVLMQDEVCTCRWCGQDFPNRFQLLQHEPKHIILKQKQWRSPLCCICERYIAGNYHNLRKHIEANHPDKADQDTTYTTQKCTICSHQYYNYKRHLRHFHEYYKCKKCEVGFNSPKILKNHKCGVINSETVFNGVTDVNKSKSFQDIFASQIKPMSSRPTSVMQLCEMCFSFMKIYIQNRHNYEVIGEKNELGVRQVCDKCNNMFFEVKLVKRIRLQTDFGTKNKVKPMSNIERLKKMQNRLKMLQKMNKY